MGSFSPRRISNNLLVCYSSNALFFTFLCRIMNMQAIIPLPMILLITLSFLIFVPIKYVYPSRLDYLTKSKILKILMHLCSAVFGISAACLLLLYPATNPVALALSLGYVILYLAISFYRTFYPMLKAKIATIRH